INSIRASIVEVNEHKIRTRLSGNSGSCDMINPLSSQSNDFHTLVRRNSYEPPPISASTGISAPSDEEITNFTRFITYSSASYCPNSKTWTCGQLCDIYGIITVNSKYREIVITFRGTNIDNNDFQNAIKDIEGWLVSYDYTSNSTPPKSCSPPNVCVHYGFYTSFLGFQTKIRNEITTLINNEQYKDYEIIVTGHSYGAALALFTALDIKQSFSGVTPYLYTYGAPRVGNSEFASFVNNNLNFTTRIVNQADSVPHIPDCCGYEQHQGEVWIANTAKNEVVKCSGNQNEHCSESVSFKDWIADFTLLFINAIPFHRILFESPDHYGPYWGIHIDESLCK
ncbi:11773_t:CDS:2, partial [Dentiscutata heterogama]